MWVHLPRFTIEYWRNDILQKVAALLGKVVGPSQQTLDRKVMTFAHICVEIHLSNQLPNSLEICVGVDSWVQQLDYETFPFHCHLCHEYGHLQ